MNAGIRYRYGLLVSFIMLSVATVHAAAFRVTIQEKEAYELGYATSYTVGSMIGQFAGMQDRRSQVSDRDQIRTLSRDTIDRNTEETLSSQNMRNLAINFVDSSAENAFKRGYRVGYGAGWTDGYQVGYATVLTDTSAVGSPGEAADVELMHELGFER